MADDLTIYGLRHKKARLLGQRAHVVQKMKPLLARLSELQARLSVFEAECQAIDEQVEVLTSTLETLGSSLDVEAVKNCAKWPNGQRRGAFMSELLKALHQTDAPQTTRDIAMSIGLVLGHDVNDTWVWRKLRSQTKGYLNLLKKTGAVIQVESSRRGGGSLWQKP